MGSTDHAGGTRYITNARAQKFGDKEMADTAEADRRFARTSPISVREEILFYPVEVVVTISDITTICPRSN